MPIENVKAEISKDVWFAGHGIRRGTIVSGRILKRGEEKGWFSCTSANARGWHIKTGYFEVAKTGTKNQLGGRLTTQPKQKPAGLANGY